MSLMLPAMHACHTIYTILTTIITITYAWAHVPTQKWEEKGHFQATAEVVTTILSETFFCIHFPYSFLWLGWILCMVEKNCIVTQVFGQRHHECVFKIILNSMMVFLHEFFLVDDFYKNSDSSRLVGIFCVPLWYTFFLLVLLFLGTSTDVDHTKNMCMQVDFCCLVVGPTTSSSRRDEHSFHFIRYFLWLACLAGSGSIPQSFQPLLPLPQKLNQTKPNHHCLPSTVTTQTRRQEKSI